MRDASAVKYAKAFKVSPGWILFGPDTTEINANDWQSGLSSKHLQIAQEIAEKTVPTKSNSPQNTVKRNSISQPFQFAKLIICAQYVSNI